MLHDIAESLNYVCSKLEVITSWKFGYDTTENNVQISPAHLKKDTLYVYELKILIFRFYSPKPPIWHAVEGLLRLLANEPRMVENIHAIKVSKDHEIQTGCVNCKKVYKRIEYNLNYELNLQQK